MGTHTVVRRFSVNTVHVPAISNTLFQARSLVYQLTLKMNLPDVLVSLISARKRLLLATVFITALASRIGAPELLLFNMDRVDVTSKVTLPREGLEAFRKDAGYETFLPFICIHLIEA